MMSSAVISCGASERDIRKRFGMAGMAHGDVAGGIEHALVGQDAARRREVFQRTARSTGPPDVLMVAARRQLGHDIVHRGKAAEHVALRR